MKKINIIPALFSIMLIPACISAQASLSKGTSNIRTTDKQIAEYKNYDSQHESVQKDMNKKWKDTFGNTYNKQKEKYKDLRKKQAKAHGGAVVDHGDDFFDRMPDKSYILKK